MVAVNRRKVAFMIKIFSQVFSIWIFRREDNCRQVYSHFHIASVNPFPTNRISPPLLNWNLFFLTNLEGDFNGIFILAPILFRILSLHLWCSTISSHT